MEETELRDFVAGYEVFAWSIWWLVVVGVVVVSDLM
jgi:hypothetical protein